MIIVTDRWLGRSNRCWTCRRETREVTEGGEHFVEPIFTFIVSSIYAANLRCRDPRDGERRSYSPLIAYVPMCSDCFMASMLHEAHATPPVRSPQGKISKEAQAARDRGGICLMDWKRPTINHTIDALLRAYPRDEPCERCDGGKSPQEGCYCNGGRVLKHGFNLGGLSTETVEWGDDRELLRIGPNPGPLFPTDGQEFKVLEQSDEALDDSEQLDLSGPWDTEGAGEAQGQVEQAKERNEPREQPKASRGRGGRGRGRGKAPAPTPEKPEDAPVPPAPAPPSTPARGGGRGGGRGRGRSRPPVPARKR